MAGEPLGLGLLGGQDLGFAPKVAQRREMEPRDGASYRGMGEPSIYGKLGC